MHGLSIFVFFSFTDPAPTEIYTLSLHDALPIHAIRNDRLLGRRTRADAISADALFQLRGRLRRRRPSQLAEQRARRDRFDGELHRHRIEVAARRAVATGSARAAKFTVGPGRSDRQTAALELGATRRHI